MRQDLTVGGIDWSPVLQQLVMNRQLPTYPGDLKQALMHHAGLASDSKGEQIYQMAVEISRLTTCCDPEVIYWFSRLVSLVQD